MHTRGARRLIARAAAILLLICLGTLRQAVYAGSTPPEYLIKAAYLYHFAMFVDWPAEAFSNKNSPIIIGIVGNDPFGPALDDTVRDKRIDGRPLVIKRLDWTQDLRQCHILFLADGSRITDVVRRVSGLSVLIVGETQDLASHGAVINFRIEGNRVRFDINVDAAKRSHLTISSQLLNLARIVRTS
jgi:YfiR/HmsC-like